MLQRDKLGLTTNPFKNNIDQRFFYADQNRAQILESTEHLIDYSSNFQVIIGETGIGKSHFLEALANRIDNNWRIAKINHAEQYDTLSLIQAILDAFGAIQGGAHSELLEALETQLAEINQLGFKPVLLIDNSQALSIDSLRFLIQLSQQKQNEEPYINIVLFACVEITEFLQSSELRDFREIIHIATLNRFDKEGMSGYLRHKMAVAGYDRQSPFTPRIIDSIFNDSQGLPEKINFFADKFLASSGKAENYIEAATNTQSTKSTQSTKTDQFEAEQADSRAAELTNQSDELASSLEQGNLFQEQNDNLMGSLMDADLQEHRSDQAAEQLNRLAETFAEIEQLQDRSDDEQADNYFSNEPLLDQHEDEKTASVLPKFIIPVAVIGLVLVAALVINSVFEKSEQAASQPKGKEKIALLPLELPPQKPVILQQNNTQQAGTERIQKTDLSEKSSPPEVQAPKSTDSLHDINKDRQYQTNPETVSETMAELGVVPQLGVVNKLDAVDLLGSRQIIEESPLSISPEFANKESASQKPVEDTDNLTESASLSMPAPVLTRIDPEPVIGSNSRQTITISGNNLEKNSSLFVTWANNKKEFSAEKTPGQWQYINNNKIKLHLSTGTKSQQWQVSAKSVHGAQSQSISFAVVRPFIANMVIKNILPNPFIGSDKRQAVTIAGQGFSKQTVLELKWDKNKKYFSSRLTPSQFEFISAAQIRLFIATGTKERKWHILASNPAGNTSETSFLVVKDAAVNNTTREISKESANKNVAVVSNTGTFNDENWLRQQPDSNYTIQLFASHNKQAIDELVSLYSLKGDILRFKTQKDGKSWFTMTYGNYASKQAAHTAVAALDPMLTEPAPWVRSMASIKEKLRSEPGQTPTIALKTKDEAALKAKDEAWIWTQNPADFTVQLVALSSEQGIKDYMKQAGIQSESVYFKTIRNGKTLYVLLYGSYADKQSAAQAREKLIATINGSTPWVRSFSTVHEMMGSR